jgi:hypothetical protein
MLFLEDKLKIQELCANSQLTMLVIFFGGSGREGIQFEETMPFRHGKLKSTKRFGKMLSLWQNMQGQQFLSPINFFSVNF